MLLQSCLRHKSDSPMQVIAHRFSHLPEVYKWPGGMNMCVGVCTLGGGGGGGCPGWFLKSTCYRLLKSFPKAAAASKIDKNTSLCNPDVRLGGERGCWLNKIILFTSFWDALKSKTDTRINVFWRQGTQIEDFLSLSSSFSNTRYQLFC